MKAALYRSKHGDEANQRPDPREFAVGKGAKSNPKHAFEPTPVWGLEPRNTKKWVKNGLPDELLVVIQLE